MDQARMPTHPGNDAQPSKSKRLKGCLWLTGRWLRYRIEPSMGLPLSVPLIELATELERRWAGTGARLLHHTGYWDGTKRGLLRLLADINRSGE